MMQTVQSPVSGRSDAEERLRSLSEAKRKLLLSLLGAEPGEAPARGADLAAALRGLAAQKLPPYMIPAVVAAVDTLPLTPNGKIDRKALAARDARAGALRPGGTPPRNGLELELVGIWEATLGLEGLGVDQNFFELGGDSLLAMRLMSAIEQSLGRQLPLSVLLQGGTVEAMARALGADLQDDSGYVVPLVRSGERAPLFLVHPISGELATFLELCRCLPPDRPVLGIRIAPGEVDTATCSVEERASRYLAAIREHQPSGPYVIAGYSSGALIAFEMARQLRSAGDELAFLGLLDPLFQARTVDFSSSADGRALLALEQALRAAAPCVGDATADLLRIISIHTERMPALRAYDPPPVDVPVTLFQSAVVCETRGGAETRSRVQALARGGLNLHIVPGNHRTMMRLPNAAALAKAIADAMDRNPSSRV